MSLVMNVLSGCGVALCALLAWGFAIYADYAWKLRKFRGPAALPIVGQLYDSKVVRVMRYLSDASKKYGKMFLFWPGNKAMLVVMEIEAARQVLTDTRTFLKGADYTEKFSVVFGEGLVTSNGETHKHDRGCLMKYFQPAHIEKNLNMLCAHTRTMMDEVLEPAVGTGKSVDMQDYFHMTALRIFGSFSVSHDYSAPDQRSFAKRLNHIVSWGSHVIGEHIILGIPMWSIIPRVRKLRHYVKVVDEHVDTLIDARIAQRKAGEECPDDTLTAMLDDNQSRDQMHAQLRTLLSAGHDTTAFFGCYMVYLLAQHPEVQDKVKEEVQRVLQGRTELTPEDIANLKYCRMVLQETLRLYTVIPFVNRTASKDYTLKGTKTTIPKGTVVLVPLTLMNRDPDLWNEPNEFRPERFAEITGHTSARNGYLPFGYGSRTCIGNTLALIEGTCMIALLMQRYRFVQDPGFKPQLIPGISLVSKNGIHVRIERDEGMVAGPNPNEASE